MEAPKVYSKVVQNPGFFRSVIVAHKVYKNVLTYLRTASTPKNESPKVTKTFETFGNVGPGPPRHAQKLGTEKSGFLANLGLQGQLNGESSHIVGFR